MVIERRITEATSIRDLFHEQWSSMRDRMEGKSERQRQEQEVSAAIDEVVTKTDARIRAINNYKKSLRQSVHGMLEHVEGLVASLPAVQLINQKSFSTCPNLNRFFVNSKEMQEIFSSSQELQEFFTEQGVEDAYLLLFLYKAEKSVLGVGMEQGQLMRDMHQTSVSFSGHRVFAPSMDESALRSTLKRMLFERVAAYIRFELSGELGLSKHHPQFSLDRVCKAMGRPRGLIRIEHNSLQVDRLGILQTVEPIDSENRIQLDEIGIAGLPREIILLTKYPRSEMLSLAELRQRAGSSLGTL